MIRNELDVLLDKVQDPALRADLRSQIDRLKQRRSFGLVFEQHIPERVRLPQHPIRVGSQVVRLLTAQREDLAARIGAPLEIVGIAVRDVSTPRPGSAGRPCSPRRSTPAATRARPTRASSASRTA